MNSKDIKTEILISLSALLLGLQFAAAQGTAFTYQGRLIDGTNRANGSYDLSFTLYDDPTSGDVLGSVTNYATAVSNGLFFVTLDFGPGVFTGATSNWLDIAVTTNGGSVFTELTPRQQVLPVPYAMRAASAAVADAALTAANAGAVSATNITGTIADAQLSTNVALLNGSPTFTGTVSANSFSGNGAGLTNVPGTFSWTVVSSTNIQLQSNLGYLFTTNALVTFTLPSTANPGDVIYISSGGLGGWKILQNSGQSIKSPNNLLNYSTWTNRPVPNTAWTGVACSTNGQRIMGVSSSSSGPISYPFVLSADGGITWRTNGFGPSYSIASAADGSVLYIGEGSGFLNISTDFGSSWASTGIGSSFNIVGLACSDDGTKVYAAGNGGFVFYSPDSGTDWFQRNQSGSWTGLACSSDGSKVVAGSSGFVFTSSNFGANWTQRSIQARYVACSSDGSRIIAAQASGAVYISLDAGATWTQQNLASANWSSVASSADGTRLVATVNGGLIFTSTDSGNTWIAQNSGSRSWSSVACSSDGTKLIAGVNFGQIWTSQLTTTTSSTTGTSGYLEGLNYSTIQLLYMGNGIWNTITASGTVLAF